MPALYTLGSALGGLICVVFMICKYFYIVPQKYITEFLERFYNTEKFFFSSCIINLCFR